MAASALNSSVISIFSYEAQPEGTGPTRGRRQLRLALEERGLYGRLAAQPLAADPDFTVGTAAELVLDELVANAVQHSRGPYRVEAEIRPNSSSAGSHLWMGVWDSNPALPKQRAPQFRTLEELDDLSEDQPETSDVPDEFGGWGLLLISALVLVGDRGVALTESPKGKTVWVRLPYFESSAS